MVAFLEEDEREDEGAGGCECYFFAKKRDA